MDNRRPLSSRKVGFFQILAKVLVNIGLSPNQISVLSMIFALIGMYGFYRLGTAETNVWLWWILAIVGIQLRLVCNLIDGLMAIEGGLKTPAGDIYNDFPDRCADVFLLLGAGLAIPYEWGKDLGWLASVLAIMTAYTRLLGASLGKGHDFSGPTAKQHRMFILTVSLILWMIEYYFTATQYALVTGLTIITIGSFLTIVNRLHKLIKKLNS